MGIPYSKGIYFMTAYWQWISMNLSKYPVHQAFKLNAESLVVPNPKYKKTYFIYSLKSTDLSWNPERNVQMRNINLLPEPEHPMILYYISGNF